MHPTVSIIIPNYNHGRFLSARIESVLQQRYQDYEIIVLDDCSTDDSRTVINRYAQHPKVSKVVMNDRNTGAPFVQWSKGIAMARGRYIWIAESDDTADPRLLEALTAQLEQHDDAAVAFVHSRLIDEHDEPLDYGWHDDDSHAVRVYDGRTFVMRQMLTSNYIYNASMAVFSKRAYEAIDTGYRQYRYCGDWAFWMSLCMQGRVVEVCRVLNAYRQHSGQTTLQSVKNGQKWMEMGQILKSAADMLSLSPIQRRCLRGRYTKRFRKAVLPNREEVLKAHGELFGGNSLDMLCYETGKLFGFLR